jgi:hypothetical protein
MLVHRGPDGSYAGLARPMPKWAGGCLPNGPAARPKHDTGHASDWPVLGWAILMLV